MLPLPAAPVDPTDAQARQAVKTFLAGTDAPPASTYDIRRYDLNADGRREAFIVFKTPYGYWCNIHGCTMMIFEAYNDHFEVLSDIQPVRMPFYVGTSKTNGWNDLIIRVSGRWDKTKEVALQFDGKAYPRDPSELPAYLRYASNEAAKLFYDY